MPGFSQPLFGIAALTCAVANPAQAQDAPAADDRRIMVGIGMQSIPAFPGSDDHRLTVLPLVDIWRDGEPMRVETPDEALGFTLIRTGDKRLGVGPAVRFAPTRTKDALPGLPKVGFGVEAGGFVDIWPVNAIRLRGELLHGIGAHKALTGTLAADVVRRRGKEGPILTAGPRLRWGSANYNRAYFGVPAPGTALLAPHDPGAGVYAIGAQAGLRLPLDRRFGLYGYAGYDRLQGPAAHSPIAAQGRADQVSAGVALTYRFGL